MCNYAKGLPLTEGPRITGEKDSEWSYNEVWLLRLYYGCGTPLSEIVPVLGRSKKAISKKAKSLFLKHGDQEALDSLPQNDSDFSDFSDEPIEDE